MASLSKNATRVSVLKFDRTEAMKHINMLLNTPAALANKLQQDPVRSKKAGQKPFNERVEEITQALHKLSEHLATVNNSGIKKNDRNSVKKNRFKQNGVKGSGVTQAGVKRNLLQKTSITKSGIKKTSAKKKDVKKTGIKKNGIKKRRVKNHDHSQVGRRQFYKRKDDGGEHTTIELEPGCVLGIAAHDRGCACEPEWDSEYVEDDEEDDENDDGDYEDYEADE